MIIHPIPQKYSIPVKKISPSGRKNPPSKRRRRLLLLLLQQLLLRMWRSRLVVVVPVGGCGGVRSIHHRRPWPPSSSVFPSSCRFPIRDRVVVVAAVGNYRGIYQRMVSTTRTTSTTTTTTRTTRTTQPSTNTNDAATAEAASTNRTNPTSKTDIASSNTTNHTTSSTSSTPPNHNIHNKYDFTSKECNIPLQIQQQMGRNLYLQPNHPLCIVQEQMAYYFNHVVVPSHHPESIRHAFLQEQQQQQGGLHTDVMNTTMIWNDIYEKEYPIEPSSSTSSPSSSTTTSYFPVFDHIPPVVSTEECFDQLLIDVYHPSRHKTDTYYINENTVLRPHTSAHQISLIRHCIRNNRNIHHNHNNKNTNTTVQFLCVGDVYRRDEIDKSHYPIFHQMEGVKLFHIPNIRNYNEPQYNMVQDYIKFHLRHTLEGMIRFLFEQKNVTDIPMRWRKDAFPFTDPSYELDIFYNNEWMEILGCGMIRYEILENVNYYQDNDNDEIYQKEWHDIAHTVANPTHISKNLLDYKTHKGWAFGIGLERLAMILFQIPDIRLFWTDDERFHQQFRTGNIRTIPNFLPYSKYPPCIKDMSFWILQYDQYHVNDTYEIIRSIGGDLVERVELIDTFVKHHRQDTELSKVSHCYRITYRSMDRSLTNAEIDAIQEQIRQQVVQQLNVELR